MFKRKDPKKASEKPKSSKFETVGRLAHKAATPFMQYYLRGSHIRVRVVIINDHKEVLLVRSWFSHQKWSLPGGGIKSTEIPAEAGVREVFEETGLRVAVDHLHDLGTFQNPTPKANYTVACFKVDIPKRPPKIAHHRRLEMLDVAWFDLDHLPKDRSESVDTALDLASR
jgi:8-oxo-dGTP pyrophosphatase MutT (NUDIX family)